jgi:hypothetical protein
MINDQLNNQLTTYYALPTTCIGTALQRNWFTTELPEILVAPGLFLLLRRPAGQRSLTLIPVQGLHVP